ncbi:MAG: VWA domain-containing protein [Proteobacteria bacterium]|nr:VWA domain-containing protein [Pseudomonadota bacterium]
MFVIGSSRCDHEFVIIGSGSMKGRSVWLAVALTALTAGCGRSGGGADYAETATTEAAAGEMAPAYPAYPPYPVDPAVRAGEPARYPDAKPNPVKRTAEQPVSTFAIDVDTASYAVVRRFLASGAKPPVDAVRVEELINYFPYDYPRPAREEVFKPFVAVAPSPWAPGKRLMHVALTGYDIPRAERPPLNLVFLVDVSGSMEGQDRLPLAKKALGVLVDQLRPQDRVAMVVYAGQSGEVLEPTSGRNKAKIMRAIRELGAGGSTAGAEGLEHAYQLARENFDEDAVNRVILMTDGDFNVGVTSEDQLEDMVADQRQTGIYLSVYGFGQDNYQDRRMQAISQAGNGTAGYIDTLDEARKVFRDDFSSSVFPIADDVKIQVEFNPAEVAEWRLLGYETRLLARQDFNNDRVDAGEVGAGATVTAVYEVTPPGGPVAVDPLRYGGEPGAEPEARRAGGDEIALVRYRFKRPGGTQTALRERPVTEQDAYPTLDAAPESTRWAVAVAGYGQRLRNDPNLGSGFGWNRLERLAQGARGEDPWGLRAEFLRLVRAAREAEPARRTGETA